MKKVLFIFLVVITFGALVSCSKESDDDFIECKWVKITVNNYKSITYEKKTHYIWEPSWVPDGYEIQIIEASYINLKTSTYEIRHKITKKKASYTSKGYHRENRDWKKDAKYYIKNHCENDGIGGDLRDGYTYKLAD